MSCTLLITADRRKAERNLKKLKRELSLSEDQSKKSDLEQRIHNAEVDLNYAMYYPLLKPYSSLYPNAKHEKNKTEDATDSEDAQGQTEEPVGPKGDHTVWRAVEEAMESGTLADLRNSRQEGAVQRLKTVTQDKQKPKSELKTAQGKRGPSHKRSDANAPSNARGAKEQDEDEEESDGGFFE